MSNAKEYLLKIHEYEMRVDRLNADISMLEDMLYKITPTLKPDSVSCSGNQDKLGSLIAERVDKVLERNRAWDQYVDCRKQAWGYLQKIRNEEYREILEKRYFGNKKIKEISMELRKEYRHTRRLHGRALQAFEKVMEKEGELEDD